MAEILHFEILRKHGQTHTQTNKQTDMGITITRPPPYGGRDNYRRKQSYMCWLVTCVNNIINFIKQLSHIGPRGPHDIWYRL